MDILNREFINLISALNGHGVRYILVGGFAVNFHGYHRTTGDIDLWMDDSKENRQKLIDTLDVLQYGYFEELLEVPMLPGYCEIILDSGIYVDLMDRIMGFESASFDKCYQRCAWHSIEDQRVPFLSFRDLLASKSSSHRLKDKLDAQELRRFKEEE